MGLKGTQEKRSGAGRGGKGNENDLRQGDGGREGPVFLTGLAVIQAICHDSIEEAGGATDVPITSAMNYKEKPMQTTSNDTQLPRITAAMLTVAAVAVLLAALALARPAAAEEALILEKTVNVPENVPGDGRQDFDTGVDVQAGDRIVVQDTGLRDYLNPRGVVYPAGRAVSNWWPATGPEGYPASGDGSCTANSNYPLSSARCFSLLGKLNGKYFYIGGSKDWVHQSSSDRLRMIVNDDAPGNGEGYFQVRIQVFRDIPLPNTTITSGPTGLVNTNSAAFGFSSDSGVGFQCKLDSGFFENCSSPQSYAGLSEREYTFYVRAIDQYGRPDPSPDQRTWTVDVTAPRVNGASPTGTGINRNTDLVAPFLEKMQSTTITKSTFKLFKVNSDGTTKRIFNTTVTPSTDGLRATLDPFGTSSTLLAKNTRYKAVVTTGAKDLAGNALDQNLTRSGSQPMIWFFNTGSS